ncbi:MAG TPA: hypothetical protein VFJ47_04910, partial [Terriglobales bacterium]|nr:hypothetical protein [Terriglobales bacterium]
MITRDALSPSNVGKFIPFLLVLTLIACAAAALAQNPASEQEDLFNQAVQAYGQNRLSDARTLFERIKGPHADEASKYISRIKTYIDAMQVADSIMSRSADELDAENLDFAIKEYQEALAIKNDGPWHPKEKLDKAVALRVKVRSVADDRYRGICQRAVDAASTRNYKLAQNLSCLLANDKPSYSCNGNEVVLMCQEMRDLAKNGSGELDTQPKASGRAEKPPALNHSSALTKAVAAYDKNDFKQAQALFQTVPEPDKQGVAEYIDKIERYQTAWQQAEKAAHENKYDQARAAYQDAMNIKPDGPGKPQEQIALMDLQAGIDDFYSGNYTQADQQLNTYMKESTDRVGLARFYIGAG